MTAPGGSIENIFGMGKVNWPHIPKSVLILSAKPLSFLLFNMSSSIFLPGNSFQTADLCVKRLTGFPIYLE